MPLDLQARLLRALQEKEIRPVGATHSIPINAHILAATNRDLATMVEQGRFRRTSTTASMSSRSASQHCAIAATTSHCSPRTFSTA